MLRGRKDHKVYVEVLITLLQYLSSVPCSRFRSSLKKWSRIAFQTPRQILLVQVDGSVGTVLYFWSLLPLKTTFLPLQRKKRRKKKKKKKERRKLSQRNETLSKAAGRLLVFALDPGRIFTASAGAGRAKGRRKKKEKVFTSLIPESSFSNRFSLEISGTLSSSLSSALLELFFFLNIPDPLFQKK
jgi:hypothetical protein